MNILLLSAYDAQSHRYWRETMVQSFPEFDWQVLALPARHFSYRVRANPLNWLAVNSAALAKHYDLVVATSTVDLATLRGICPALAHVPAWLYCHENQFAYPDNPAHSVPDAHRLAAQMVFVYACLAAQAISFNSRWNHDSAMAGIRKLSSRLPEPIDERLIAGIASRSQVLPVPVDSAAAGARPSRAAGAPLRILWNHRWEFDKGPDLLLAIIRQLVACEFSCELAIVGQQFRSRPAAFDAIDELLKNTAHSSAVRLSHWGYVSAREDYLALLGQSDVVLSTAWHDFQGLAVLEAVAAGAVPLLPDRLAYPELFAPGFMYSDSDGDATASARSACDKLLTWQQQGLPPVPDLSDLSVAALRPRYRQQMIDLVASANR